MRKFIFQPLTPSLWTNFFCISHRRKVCQEMVSFLCSSKGSKILYGKKLHTIVFSGWILCHQFNISRAQPFQWSLGWNHLQTKLGNELYFYLVKQSLLARGKLFLLSKKEDHYQALFLDYSSLVSFLLKMISWYMTIKV